MTRNTQFKKVTQVPDIFMRFISPVDLARIADLPTESAFFGFSPVSIDPLMKTTKTDTISFPIMIFLVSKLRRFFPPVPRNKPFLKFGFGRVPFSLHPFSEPFFFGNFTNFLFRYLSKLFSNFVNIATFYRTKKGSVLAIREYLKRIFTNSTLFNNHKLSLA